MKVIDHGEWAVYEPAHHLYPELKANRVAFCQRVSDRKDWYEFQKEVTDPHSVKMTISKNNTVMATAFDISFLFPADMRLIEVADAGADHETFRQKRYDGHRFLDAIPMAIHRVSFLITLHKAGLLTRWREYVAGLDNVALQLALTEAPLLRWEDRRIQRAFSDLGFDETFSRQLFDAAKKETDEWLT